MLRKLYNFARKEIDYWYCAMNAYVILLFLYIFVIHFNLLFYNDFKIEYKSFYNINLHVSDSHITGRLNNVWTTRHFNKNCHIKYCGLPNEGKFDFSEVKFIKIYNDYFLLYSCVKDEKEECFYNITENDIERIKQDAVYHAKDELKWAIIIVVVMIPISFIHTWLLIKTGAKKRHGT